MSRPPGHHHGCYCPPFRERNSRGLKLLDHHTHHFSELATFFASPALATFFASSAFGYIILLLFHFGHTQYRSQSRAIRTPQRRYTFTPNLRRISYSIDSFLTVRTASPTSTDVLSSTLIFVKNDDVELKLLDENGNATTTVRVSSDKLSSASLEFKYMFSDRLFEDQAPSPQFLCEISLLDDGQGAILRICKIIHHQPTESPKKLSLEGFVAFAHICNEYGCEKAVNRWSRKCYGQLFYPGSTTPKPFADCEQLT